jgi:hypothetical protein
LLLVVVQVFAEAGLIVGTLSTKVSLSSKVSVTRLGKILPIGQKFLALGDFYSRKKLHNDLGKILVE